MLGAGGALFGILAVLAALLDPRFGGILGAIAVVSLAGAHLLPRRGHDNGPVLTVTSAGVRGFGRFVPARNVVGIVVRPVSTYEAEVVVETPDGPIVMLTFPIHGPEAVDVPALEQLLAPWVAQLSGPANRRRGHAGLVPDDLQRLS